MVIKYNVDKNYRLEITVSKECYTVKPIRDNEADKYPANTPRVSSIRWKETNLTVDEFAGIVERGGCFCPIFNHDNGYIARKRDKFKLQWYIGIDCDGMPMPLEEFLALLPIPPSIAYRTPSDGVKGNMYRLFYFLDNPLTSEKEVKGRYYGLLEELGVSQLIRDNCGGQCNRYFNGAYNHKPIVNYTVLQTDTIPQVVFEKTKGGKAEVRKEMPDDFPIDETFASNFRSETLSSFLNLYGLQYGYYNTSTPLEYNTETGIASLPEDYVEIRGTVRKGKLLKVQDGYRHKTLAVVALKLVKLNREMPIEQLIYALARHASDNFDLSDRNITADKIIGIAQWAMKHATEIHIKKDGRKFRASRAVAVKKGKSVQKLIGEELARRKDEQVGMYFDPLKTDKENIALLKANGVAVGSAYLKGFRERHNCTVYETRLTAISGMYSNGVSDKDIMSALCISKPTLYKFKRIIFGKKNRTSP